MASKQRWLGLMMVMLLILAGCGSTETPVPTPTPEEEKVFKVGILGPLTGPSSAAGVQMQQAAQMAFETVDYQIGEYQLEVMWIDSQSMPEVAREAYENAIAEGLQAGALNWHSDVALSVMEVTARHQVPHFFGMAGADLINQNYQSDSDRYAYWGFKGWPISYKLTGNYVTVIETAIAEGLWEPEARRAGIYGEDTDWGHSMGHGLKRQLEEAGWEVVIEQYVALDTTDFSDVIAAFKQEGVVLIGGTATAAEFFPALFKEADAQEFEAVIISDGLNWTGYDNLDATANYVVDQSPGWVTDAAQAFAVDYEARWASPPSPSSAGLSYDYTRFFIQLMELTLEEHGELTAETLHQFAQNYLKTGDVAFTNGIIMPRYQYTPETVPDPVVGQDAFLFPVVQCIDSEGVIIWPDVWAEAEFDPGY